MNDDHHHDDLSGHEGGLDDELMIELLAWCARQMLRDPNPHSFVDRLAAEGPSLFPAFFGGALADRADAARFFRAFGWRIASHMPLPSLGFRANKLTPPGRNDPCPCGSLAKYKRCCAAIAPTVPQLDDALLGGLVIEALPRSEWAALPASRVPLRMVEAAAELLCDADRRADAARLLQGWSALPAPWPDARADLLDLLGDIYLDLGKPRKRKQLAQAMVAHGGPLVQSKGWQLLCLLATDAGDEAGARDAFEAAQRLAPNDPSVAILEVTTLAGQGDLARARERADFHARRLSRLPQSAALVDAIATLTALSQAGSRLERELQGGRGGDDPAALLAPFQTWLEAVPEARLRLVLPNAAVADLGQMRPTPATRKALARWHDAFRFTAPMMAWAAPGEDAAAILDVGDWLPVLHAHPLLADCFDVLDGLLLALETQAAAARVDSAVAENPYLRKLLLAARAPRVPNVPSYRVGSLDEAKIILAPQFDLWRDDPLIREWIRRRLDPAPAAMAALFASTGQPEP